MEIDTGNMCSHLKRKLFEEDGPYHKIWLALQADNELTAIVRSRQLHIYRNGKMVLILAGKAAPKVLIEDRLAALIGAQTKQGISLDDVIPQNVVCSQELRAFFVENIGKGFHFKAEFQDWLHNNAGKTYKEAVALHQAPKGNQAAVRIQSVHPGLLCRQQGCDSQGCHQVLALEETPSGLTQI